MAPIFLLDYCPYDHEEAETLRGKGAAWPRPRCLGVLAAGRRREQTAKGLGTGGGSRTAPGQRPDTRQVLSASPSSLPPDQHPSHFSRPLSVNGGVAGATRTSWLRWF